MTAPKEIGLLDGWAVLELSDGVAASFAAKVLADIGANVTLFEPDGRHTLRDSLPSRPGGPSGKFAYLSSRKALSSDDPSALIARSRVIVTDWSEDRLSLIAPPEARPSTVFISPYGATGPKAGAPAEHLTIFHASGEGSTLPSGRGFELYPDRPPVQLGSEIAFYDAGWTAALVAIALMRQMMFGGDTSNAEVSILEAELSCSRTRMNRWLNEGVCVSREGPRYGIAGMLRCRDDGWIQLVGMREESWDRLATSEQGGTFRDAGFSDAGERSARQAELGVILADWCRARSKFDAASILSEAGAPVGVFADAADCLANEQLRHRGFWQQVDDRAGGTVKVPGPPYVVTDVESAIDPPKVPVPGRLLEGVKVLDFTWAAAGPYATLLLGFLGADVVKVESARRVDPARYGFISRTADPDRSPIFNELNLGKRSISIDLTQPEGQQIVRELLPDFDVVVDNFRPGVMARLGLGAESLLSDFPHLVVASSSAYGATGPEATGAGLASIFAASGGLSDQTGYLDGPPTEVSDTMDYRCGTALAVAVAAAVVRRELTGVGCAIDLASRDVALASAPDAALAESLGVEWQARIGNDHRLMHPHDVYPCGNGEWVAIAVPDDRSRKTVSELLGQAGQEQHRIDLDAELTSWTKTRPADEVASALRSRGIPAEPVMSFEALATDPHLTARGVFVAVEHPELGRQQVMRAPWVIQNSPPFRLLPGPLFGQHTGEVLAATPTAKSLSPERRTEVLR